MFEKIYTQIWVELSQPIRMHLAKVFDLPRTGISEIKDMTLISDGHTNKDLESITLEKMNEYIGSEELFARAWELTLAKAKYELNPPTIVVGVGELKDQEEEKEDVKKTTKQSK